MAKVKTKKAVAQTKTDLDIVMALHPDLPWQDDEEDAAAAKSAEKTTIEQLEAKIAALEAAPRNQPDLLPYTAAAVKPLPPRVITELDTKGLPDPTVEPERYASEMAKRTKQMLDSQTAYARWEQDQANDANSRASALWAKFSEKYPDYADDYETVEFFATKAAKEAASMGLDVDRYMYSHSDRFFQDVVAKMDKVLKKEPVEEVEEEPENRAVGMFGGQESGNRPNKAAEGPDMDPFKAVREFQLRTGFHH